MIPSGHPSSLPCRTSAIAALPDFLADVASRTRLRRNSWPVQVLPDAGSLRSPVSAIRCEDNVEVARNRRSRRSRPRAAGRPGSGRSGRHQDVAPAPHPQRRHVVRTALPAPSCGHSGRMLTRYIEEKRHCKYFTIRSERAPFLASSRAARPCLRLRTIRCQRARHRRETEPPGTVNLARPAPAKIASHAHGVGRIKNSTTLRHRQTSRNFALRHVIRACSR